MKKRKRVFRRKVVIEEYTIAGRDEYNQPIEDWVPYMSVRAEIDPLRGREYWASRQVQAELIHRVSFRYSKKAAQIKPTMRVRWGERMFEITAPPINPMEQNYEIQLMCKEMVN